MMLDYQGVLALLPHRDPMLLIHGAQVLEPGVRAEAHWTPDSGREIFRGHFPGDPVLPGVYTVEAMAQAADLVVLSLERYAGKAPLLIGIDGVRLTRKIQPGQRLDITAQLESERADKGICTCRCTVTVAGQPAAQATVTLAMRSASKA